MKFKVVSDIHLEMYNLVLPREEDTVLLLAGDICVADQLHSTAGADQDYVADCKRFFEEDCAGYKAAYYVMGNHEHYHGMWQDTADSLKFFLKDSPVKLLEKESVSLDTDLVLWGATFWTNMNNENPMNMEAARRGMNDYYVIRYGQHATLHPVITVHDHKTALEALQTFLDANPDKKVVVMTHMAPSPRSCHPRHGINDPLNWAYYSNLDGFILNNPQIKVWVHGHTHDSHDYMIDSTRVICNPRGYANSLDRQENEKFDINKTFEV